MVEKINLWNFDEFENFFLEEEDTVKICVFSSLLFENWSFKHKKNKNWPKLIRKIMKIIDNVYEQYFNDGFQYKTFSPEDKIALSVLFGLIQRIYGFSEEPPAVKLQDRILKFAICFDLDVIIMTFSTIYMIGEPISFSRTNSLHYEIFYKLAEFDSSFNDTFTHIKDKIFRPIPNLNMKKSPIDTFWESSSSFKASDTYITVLRKISDKNEQFRTILKQNSIMIVFSTLNSNEYYHRLSSTYDILDLERDRDFIKNLNVDKILANDKNKFMEIIEKSNLKGKLESFYKEASDYKEVYKYLSFVRDLDLEVKWCFERYLIFCAGYDLNIIHFIYILELGEPNGFFYQSLENALRNPEYDKLNVFSLFESLIRFENQSIINCDIILDFILKYLNSKNNDNLQCFLKNILIFIKENDDCAAALLKENCVEKFCEYLENNNINENKDIFIVLIDILFYLYKKQNTKLEPFEESRFSSVCLKLISLKNEQVSIRCFNIFSYFINADPLSIETLSKLGIDKLLENVKDLACNVQVGICLVNFIDALSLNIRYAKKLRDESLFSSILSGLNIYDIKAPLIPDGNLIDSISIFLRHHPEYNEEYSLFCLDRFEKMVDFYKVKNPSETEIRAIENFLESFSHLKANTVLDKKDYKERMVKLLVELYDQISIRGIQPVSGIFTLYQMFVSILGYLDNEGSSIQFIIPKLENIVNKMKKDNLVGEEFKFLMLKGEKLLSLISGIIDNFLTVKLCKRSLLEKAVNYSLDLFILTIDFIDGTYDHDTMGGSFISSYVDLGSKFNKEQNDSRDNFKLSSILICLNNVYLLKYAIDDFDTAIITNERTFFEKYLSLISDFLYFDNRNKKKRVKRNFMNEKQNEKFLILLKVIQHLSEYFDKKLFQNFVFWIFKHDLFKNFDERIRELILEILASCVSIYIDYEYKKMVIEFLRTFDKKNMKISPLILSTITNFYGLDRKSEVDFAPALSFLVSKHFYPECKYRFRFLMGNLDFIINNIKDKNYSLFVDSITEDTLGYFALLINFHYEDAMFNLFKCILEVLTFVKKKFEKEKLVLFTQKLKEKNLFEINYNFDDENIFKKLVDKDGFIQIDPEFVVKRLKNEIKIVSNFEKYNVDWGFFLVCEKYCEVRANKFGILLDSSLLICALHGNVGDIAFLPMLVVHSIFSDLHDLYDLKNKILDKKDVLTFYGLENDNYDYFPLAYRNPNLIFMKDEPVYENLFESLDKHDEIIDHCLRFLQEESTVHEKYLFVLSEILYNYPRYIRSIDLYYLQIMCECYLDDDLEYIKDPDKQIAARRALELFSICVHSRDSDFMITFIEFIKSILNGSVNEIVNAIIILCNVSNPLNTLTSGLEHGVKDKNVFLAFTEFMKNDIFDLFVSVISKLNPNELPDLKELSNNSETLNTNLGMKNSSFFLLQNQIFGFDSYDISEFNSNSMNNSHDDLLNVALNFIYNVLYTIFQKEIEDSGICDIEISDDDLEDDFESTESFYEDNDNETSSTTTHETDVEDVFEDAENAIINEESKLSEESTNDAIPMIRSTYLRFETVYKAIEEDNMRLIFENISKLVSKVEEEAIENEMEEETEEETEVKNDEETEIEEDYSEESSVGVYDGFIPDKTIEEVNEMDENEFDDFIENLMNERKSSNLDYKPIDKNYLDGLIEPFRVKFESQEAHLKDFYYPEIDVFSEKNEGPEITEIDIRLSENTVLNFIDAFYSGKFIGKPQIFNIFKIMSLSKTIREILLVESVSKLVKEVDDLKNESYDNNYENIRKSMELIRIVTLKFKLENEDQKIKILRSLFKLLRHKSTAIKALHLLNKIEFEKEIFNVTESDKLKEEMVLDILKLSEAWISKKTSNFLRNVIRKICKGTINILPFSIVDSITKEFLSVLNCDESLILQKFIESQGKILNLILIFDICFSSFFDLFRNEFKESIELFFMKMGTECKNIENLDFKHLYNQILCQNTTQGLISADLKIDFNFVNIIKSLNYLIKDCIEKLIRKLTKEKNSMIDYYYMSGLYNVYFLIFSVYEGLINHFCVFSSERKDLILEQYDELRNELGLFLNSNINEINSIFSVEKDVFSQNIRFLSRFNVINFVNKHNYFRGKIQDYDLYKEGTYTINVRRNDVLSDSLFQIMNKTSVEFKAKRLQVKFSGEEGLDFGGITREWVDLLVKDLTMPDKGLFVYTSDKKTTFLPYRNSKVNPDHLLYFRFVGRILAKSILDRITLDLQIDKSVYKYFLGKKCELSDLEPIDPQFYNSLIWMRDNTIEDVIVMTFSFEYFEFGELKTIDLKPNGRNISVTDENKQEYIDLIVDYKLFKGIEIQLNSMKTGLFEIIDRDLLSIFNENEFELLINGIPDINVDDWMNATEYHGYKSNSTNIIWFWKAVRSFSPEERAKLLQFSTGSSRVPFEGFSHLQGNNGPQKFSIHKSSSDNVRLPSTHTCFNQLDLPEYPSFNDLRKSLIYAINECSEGFGLI